MSLIVRALRRYLPASVKKRGLGQLFTLTADAFGTRAPDTSGMPFDEALREYAQFTSRAARNVIMRRGDLPPVHASGDPSPVHACGLPPFMQQRRCVQDVHSHLYQNAYRMGEELRELLRIATPGEAASAFELLYGAIGIECSAQFPGEVLVTECFFSRFYTGEVCKLISALDSGIAAGLAGGGSLAFGRRITEGCESCHATFTLRSQTSEPQAGLLAGQSREGRP